MAFDLTEIIKIAPAAIIGLTVHEFSHGYMAYKLGDDTAKNDGRLTLNPLKHIDWFGLLFIIIAGFGWAKPVVFNPNNLKNKHRDEIFISLAGPVSNFVLAIFFLITARILYFSSFFYTTETGLAIINILLLWAVINFGLFIFNLIPIPPLDGSHFYMTFLQELHPRLMLNLYRWGTFGLFVLLILEDKLNINIFHLSDFIGSLYGFFMHLLGF